MMLFSFAQDGTTAFPGGKSVCSGQFDNSIVGPQHTELFTLNVLGPQVISLYWKVSCVANSDFLALKVDTKIKGKISPSLNGYVANSWVFFSFSFDAVGNHTLRLDYFKEDGSTAFEGEDRRSMYVLSILLPGILHSVKLTV